MHCDVPEGLEASLVAGRPSYMRRDAFVREGVRHEHCEPDPVDRVRAYLRAVDDNGVFYGLMPHGVLDAARPLPNVLGNDWLHVCRIACQGRIRTLSSVSIHREVGGTSSDVESILLDLRPVGMAGAGAAARTSPGKLLRDIAWGHPVYTRLGRRRRLILALSGATASVRWQALAWHLVTPSVVSVAGRPRGRLLYKFDGSLTRALGAGWSV